MSILTNSPENFICTFSSSQILNRLVAKHVPWILKNLFYPSSIKGLPAFILEWNWIRNKQNQYPMVSILSALQCLKYLQIFVYYNRQLLWISFEGDMQFNCHINAFILFAPQACSLTLFPYSVHLKSVCKFFIKWTQIWFSVTHSILLQSRKIFQAFKTFITILSVVPRLGLINM